MAAEKTPQGHIAPMDILRQSCGRHLDNIAPLLGPLPLTALDAMTMGDLLVLGGRTRDPHLTLMLAGLFAALNDGSVCLRLSAEEVLGRQPDTAAAAVRNHLEAFNHNLTAGVYADLIAHANGDAHANAAPLIHVSGLGVPGRPDLLYFQRFYRHEQGLRSRFEALLDLGRQPLAPEDRIDALVGELWQPERVIRLGAGRTPLTADRWQQDALRLVLSRALAVVSGGPGTGKTSLMVNMLRLLVACGVAAEEIRLTAPTGRAAQRMLEAIQICLPGIDAPTEAEKTLGHLQAVTLHRLLGLGGGGRAGDHYHAGHPLPARVVIVDEVSMIDLGMLDRLLQAIDIHHTRLILMGDKDQLPSVEAGAVFADIVPRSTAEAGATAEEAVPRPAHRFGDHFVLLRTSYRSGRRLLALAEAVNQGELPALPTIEAAAVADLSPDHCARLGHQSHSQVASIITSWVDQHYYMADTNRGDSFHAAATRLAASISEMEPASREVAALFQQLFEVLGRSRMLTIARRGPRGCIVLNRLAMAYLVGRYGLACDPDTGLFNGAPILITKNDYKHHMYNGDVGVALLTPQYGLRVYVQRGSDLISAPVQALGAWEPAFATTVHKSQGSEYDDVLLVFPGDPLHRLLSREIVYTGVTRARQRLVMVAQLEELQTALERRLRRTSGLMWSLDS